MAQYCSKASWIEDKICGQTCAAHGFITDSDCVTSNYFDVNLNASCTFVFYDILYRAIYKIAKILFYCFTDPLCTSNDDCTGTEVCNDGGTDAATCGMNICTSNLCKISVVGLLRYIT